jgi:hypothetical protein
MRAYKFLDEKWGLEDIAERRVKVSTFADMNDPFELLGRRSENSGADDAFIAHASGLGAMCLSRNCTDPLLWAHYADKHRGICLGIDIPDNTVECNPVVYVGERALMDPQQGSLGQKLFTKYEGWKYEDEVRLLKWLEPQGHTFVDFNNEDFIFRQVILGLRSTQTKQSIENRLRGYRHDVEILMATLSPDEFRIIPRPIDDCAPSRSAHS